MKKRILSVLLCFSMVIGSFPVAASAEPSASWTYPDSAPAAFTLGTDGTTTNAGTAGNPYAISSAQDLANLSYLVNNGTLYAGKYFKMTDNIVLNDGTFDAVGTFTPTIGGTAVRTWTPIGIFKQPDPDFGVIDPRSFRGSFDGDGYIISGLYINNALNYQGLFGEVESGLVTDLGVENSYIKSNNSVGGITAVVRQDAIISGCHYTGYIIANSQAGGIAGALYGGAVSNCYSAGSVSANTGGYAGGIAAYSDDNANAISDCYSTAAVSGGYSVGGIIGNIATCPIINCSSSGNVTGTGNDVGGIVGYMGTYAQGISNCYSTGNVAGINQVGGIVGSMTNANNLLSNCYATGSVSGTIAAGGITGLKTAGTVTNCYWKESAPLIGIGSGAASATCVSKTAIEMQTSNFVNLLNTNAKALNVTAGSKKYSYWLSDSGSVNDDYPLFGTGYYMTFDQNGGTGASAAYAISKSNGTVDLPATSPAKAGETFKGWHTASTGGSQFTAASTVSADRILYAQYGTISADAGLAGIAGQNDTTPTGGAGTTTATAIIWSVDAANSVSALTPTDIVSAADSTVALYADASFTTTTASIALTAGVAKTAYIKVTAQNGTTIKYYAVTITRSIITVNGTKIYAHGNRLTLIAGTTPGYTVAYYETDYDGVLDPGEPIQIISGASGSNDTAGYDLSTFDVYGGSNIAAVNNPTIYFYGGAVKNLYGGGDGQNTTGWVNVIVKGGTVKGDIYLGGRNSSANNLGMNILGGTIEGDVKGSSEVSGSVFQLKKIGIGGGTICGAVTDCTESQLLKYQLGAPSPFSVYKTTLTLDGIASETAVTSGTLTLSGVALDYGLTDTKTTAAGQLTLYLPTGAAIATYASANYAVTVAANHNNAFSQLNASIAPATASFDKRSGSANNTDVVVTKTDNTYTLLGIKYGVTSLTSGTAFTVSGSSVTINKGYLATLTAGTNAILTFDYSGGTDPALTIAVSESTLPPETTPTVGINYTTEQLTGFSAGETYTVSSGAITPVAGTLAIDSAWMGHMINIVAKGDGTTSSDSSAQALAVPARPGAPGAIGHEPVMIDGTGSITGLDSTMEYGTNGTNWTAVSAGTTSIAGLTAGTYYVRAKATADTFAGINKTITINAFGATAETTPAAAADYANEKLTGLVAGASYLVDTTEYSADGNGKLPILASWLGNNISIVKKGDAITTTNSDPQTLAIAGRPTTPEAAAFTVNQPAASGAAATIAGITASMEYSINAGMSWTDGTGAALTKADGTTVRIRVKATGAAPCSLNYSITLAYTPAGGGGNHNSNSGGVTADPVKTTVNSGEEVKVDNLSKIVSEGEKLTVQSDLGTVVFDTTALSAIDSQTTEKITVVIEKAADEKLSDEQKALIGDRPVFDLTVLSGGKQISDFNSGKVTVTLPYELKEGEEAGGVVVWYLADDGTLIPVSCTYDEKTKAATFTVTHFSQYVVGYDTAYDAAWVNPFTDIAAGAWYYESVGFAYQNELMLGKSGTLFSPNGSTTRSMIVSILWRMEGQPTASGTTVFKDVTASAWYAEAVAWASANGIVSGYTTEKFAPEDKITREQMAAILYRYAAYKGMDVTKQAELSIYADAAKISAWADKALAYANAEGLISGVTATTLNPGGDASRAQVAAILQRFLGQSEE